MSDSFFEQRLYDFCRTPALVHPTHVSVGPMVTTDKEVLASNALFLMHLSFAASRILSQEKDTCGFDAKTVSGLATLQRDLVHGAKTGQFPDDMAEKIKELPALLAPLTTYYDQKSRDQEAQSVLENRRFTNMQTTFEYVANQAKTTADFENILVKYYPDQINRLGGAGGDVAVTDTVGNAVDAGDIFKRRAAAKELQKISYFGLTVFSGLSNELGTPEPILAQEQKAWTLQRQAAGNRAMTTAIQTIARQVHTVITPTTAPTARKVLSFPNARAQGPSPKA